MLDLSPIVQQLADRVGLTEEQVEERLGPDAGRIVIMEADQLGTVQTAVELIRKLSIFLAIAILVLFAIAVYLAKGRRRETLRAVGITFVVVGALLLVIRSLTGNWIVDTLASGESVRESASDAWFIGTDLLAGIAWTAIAYGAIVILAALIAGPLRPAVSVRQRLAPSLRDRPGLVYAIVGLLYLLVVAWGPTPAFRQPWSILIFAALTGLGVEAFRRLTVREFRWRRRRHARRRCASGKPARPVRAARGRSTPDLPVSRGGDVCPRTGRGARDDPGRPLELPELRHRGLVGDRHARHCRLWRRRTNHALGPHRRERRDHPRRDVPRLPHGHGDLAVRLQRPGGGRKSASSPSARRQTRSCRSCSIASRSGSPRSSRSSSVTMHPIQLGLVEL